MLTVIRSNGGSGVSSTLNPFDTVKYQRPVLNSRWFYTCIPSRQFLFLISVMVPHVLDKSKTTDPAPFKRGSSLPDRMTMKAPHHLLGYKTGLYTNTFLTSEYTFLTAKINLTWILSLISLDYEIRLLTGGTAAQTCIIVITNRLDYTK